MGELAVAGSSLLDMQKRVSWLYLVSAFGVASALFTWRYGCNGLRRLRPFLSPSIWLHPSSRTDFGLWLINRLVLALVIPKALTHMVWVSWLYYFWQSMGLSDLALGWPTPVVIGLFSLSYFLLDDFSRFFTHWLLHKVPALWLFHQVHHSATVLTPFTVFRTHPVEGGIFFLRSLATQSFVVSLFVVLFPNQVSLWQIFGVLGTTFIFNLLGANLRHSQVVLSYGETIERWLISPAQHQIHHSKAQIHYDRNFGVTLAIWDRLFGCWVPGDDDQVLQYGTGQAIDQKGVLGQWCHPILTLLQRVSRGILVHLPFRKHKNAPRI